MLCLSLQFRLDLFFLLRFDFGLCTVLLGRGEFRLDITTLERRSVFGNACLPCWCSDILDSIGILEHSLRLFQCLAGSFREKEENVEEHDCVEYTEDDVCLPSDVDEGGWHE